MPDMIPVATQIQPPDPSKGLSLLSSMLDLKQKQQALQTGAYQQQTAQAGAIEAQQHAKELQAGSRLLADPIGNGLIDEEGNPTKNAYSIIKSVMPTSGDDRYQDLLKVAKGHVEFRNSVQNLSQNEQGYISSRLAGIAADPAAHISDVVSGINDLKNQFKGTAEEESINRLVKVMKDAVDDAGDHHGMDGVRKVLNGFSRGAIGNAGITGPGGIATPTRETMQAPGGLQVINTNPYAPQGIGPMGAPMTQAPQPITGPAGQILNRNPGSGALSLPPQATPTGNLNPTTAQVETTRGLAAGVTQRVAQAQAAANNTVQAQDALGRAKAILEQPGAIDTGAAFEKLKGMKNLFASLGIDTESATDANSLVKNLARYEAARATQAGLGGTDAARELAHNGSPNTQIDRKALIGIINQSLATEKALAAYAKKQSAVTDPGQLQQNETAFRSIPNLVEGYEYGMSRSPEEANAFLGKHGLKPADMKRTRDAIKAFEAE